MTMLCRKSRMILLLVSIFAWASSSHALDIVDQFPAFSSHMARTADPLSVTFDQSLNTGTVTGASFYVTRLYDATHIPGAISFAATDLANDTVIFTPSSRWTWGQRFELHITNAVQSAGGDPFSGTLPYDGIFAANIPNDFEIPVYDPGDPLGMLDYDTLVLMGYNPLDPEADADPWDIPGVNVTGAWKYSTGHPEVIVAIIDDGLEDFDNTEIRRAFFLNEGELPKPNVGGAPCAEYDCNEDGRFNVDDYLDDNRLSGPPYSPYDLIQAFSDSVDDDGNGLVDDISGWDFFRGVNLPFGVDEFPEGTHGQSEIELVVMEGDNGIGRLPGICPECRVIMVRTSAEIIYDYNLMAAGVKYAMSMGASVLNFAGVNYTYSDRAHQAFLDAFDQGAISVAASGDEMTFHHWMPAAAEDVLSVKTLFPLAPVDLIGDIDLGLFGFTETYCTNYGTHTHLAVPARTGCTSDSTGNTTGMAALLYSYAKEQGIDLTADEIKQILTMTADDVYRNCATIVNLLGECQVGYDEHFAYGRPNMEPAMQALGDPDLGIDPAIPPVVRIEQPKWWRVFDPVKTPQLAVTGQISSRVTPYQWKVQIAPGNEPKENQFVTLANGSETAPIDGLIANIDLGDVFSEDWARGTPKNQYTFEATLRVQATYSAKGKGTVKGEGRKSIGIHIDDDPDYGLVEGFPVDIGASGESSPILYDLDGDLDQRMEIVFGGSDGNVYALKYYEDGKGSWQNLPGFPVDLAGDDPWVLDGIFASLAVGDLFGDGTPEIVAATMRGNVYALDPALAEKGDPILPGFPVSADPRPNDTAFDFAYGNGFLASPVLADLDGDGMLEIIAASRDQQVYAWKPMGASKQAERLSGWPVLCRSEPGLVPANKVCEGMDIPGVILGTPAAGILDPDSEDGDISQFPAVIVTTSEACEGAVFTESRAYAIFHDGMDHADGPFLPGWPAKVPAPLGDSIPIPLASGSPSSPAVVVTEEETKIAVSSTAWLPLLLNYKNGTVNTETMLVPAVNTVGSASFSSLAGDGALQYILPMTGALRFDELGFQLLNSKLIALDLEKPHDKVLQGEIEDMPLLVNSSVADLDGDGLREVIGGTGGYLVHAFNLDGAEAPHWPKYTQKWTVAAPAVGDLDADDRIEVIVHTREGVLYAWESAGPACPDGEPNSDWPRFHHDEHNSGFYGEDVLPPIRVVDLAAVIDEGGTITLSFTAPGDDWGCGTAFSYDIRYSTDDSADLSDPEQFAAATPLGSAPDPVSGGEPISFTVDAPGAAHFALQAVDDAGRLSRISNDTGIEPATDDDDDASDDDDVDDDDDTIDDDDDDDAIGGGGDDDDDNGCGC